MRRLWVTSSPTSPLPRVAPRSKHAVAVEQRDRQPVDLRLGDELERRVLDPLAREVVAHAVDPGAQLLLRARVGQREHRLQVRDLLELADRLAADALGRRVGRQQLRVLALDRAQLVQQRVVGVVADLGVVEDVVAVAVVGELLAQLGRPRSAGRHRSGPAAGRGRTPAALHAVLGGEVEVQRRDRDPAGGDRGEVGPRLVVVDRRVAVDAVELAAATSSSIRSQPVAGRCACPAARPRRRRCRRRAR